MCVIIDIFNGQFSHVRIALYITHSARWLLIQLGTMKLLFNPNQNVSTSILFYLLYFFIKVLHEIIAYYYDFGNEYSQDD